MERIKRALEFARAERAQGVRQGSTLAIAPAARPRAGDAAVDGDASGVEFWQSRSVRVREDALRAGRLLLPGVVGDAEHAFKMLRTQVLHRLRQRGWNTLAIVSPTPHDGKTFTAINLAIAIAGDPNFTALLVDLDLRQPSVHTRFGIDVAVGVDECLRGEAALTEALIHPFGYDRLLLLPGRAAVQNSSELLATERARSTIRGIKERYPNRIVLFDLPPVLGTDDALMFVPQVDAALVVVADGCTRREDLLRLFEVLRDVPVIGTVLNGSRIDSTGAYAY